MVGNESVPFPEHSEMQGMYDNLVIYSLVV